VGGWELEACTLLYSQCACLWCGCGCQPGCSKLLDMGMWYQSHGSSEYEC